MSSHFPLWCAITTSKSDEPEGHTTPFVFSTSDRMAAWMKSQSDDSHWHVRVLTQDSALQWLGELRLKGTNQIIVDLFEKSPQKMSIADFVLLLAKT
jgi:hypothetical protein